VQYATIIDSNAKPVALIVHDPKAGRVVFKGKQGSELEKSFSFALDRPVVTLENRNGSQIRRKLLPTQTEYLRPLLDRFVHIPYKVKSIEDATGSHRLDSLSDKLEQELLK
jgi:hypothetical protein